MGEGRRVSRTNQTLSSGWWLGALWVAAASVSASASAPPAIADAAGALEAATARWSLLKCPPPHAIELEPAEQSWIVRFRIMGAKDAISSAAKRRSSWTRDRFARVSASK